VSTTQALSPCYVCWVVNDWTARVMRHQYLVPDPGTAGVPRLGVYQSLVVDSIFETDHFDRLRVFVPLLQAKN